MSRHMVHDHPVAGGVEEGREQAVDEEDQAQRTDCVISDDEEERQTRVAAEERGDREGPAPSHPRIAGPVHPRTPEERLQRPGQARQGEM
jgi:hypothetical protein